MCQNATTTELNKVTERVSMLGHLSVMFGEANADSSGAKNVNLDMEMVGADADTLHTPCGPVEPTDFEVILPPTSPAFPKRIEEVCW
jgi:hypothetical protein